MLLATRLKSRWGEVFLALVIALSLAALARSGLGGHYKIFAGASRALWDQLPAYGQTFGSPSGYWFYSPFCGMFFFGLFSWLPDTWGQIAYMAASLAVLWLGFRTWTKTQPRGVTPQIFFLLGSSELVGAILNARLEVASLGILWIAAAFIFGGQKSRPWASLWGGLLLALVCNWKLQCLPSAGLLLALALVRRRDGRAVAAFVFGLVAFFLIPYAFLDKVYLDESHRLWRAGLQGWMERPQGRHGEPNWLTYPQIYTWLVKTWGARMSLGMAQGLGAVVGLGFLWSLLRNKKEGSPARALSLGAAFSCSFLPLSQSAGYVLWLPLLWELCVREKKPRVASFVSWIFVSMLSSDFVPKAARLRLADHAFKALGPLVALLGLGCWPESKRDREPRTRKLPLR